MAVLRLEDDTPPMLAIPTITLVVCQVFGQWLEEIMVISAPESIIPWSISCCGFAPSFFMQQVNVGRLRWMCCVQYICGIPVDPKPCFPQCLTFSTVPLKGMSCAIRLPAGIYTGGDGVQTIACIWPVKSASITPGSMKSPRDVVLNRPNNKALKSSPRGPYIERGILRTALSFMVISVAVVTSTPALSRVCARRLAKPLGMAGSGVVESGVFVSGRTPVSCSFSPFPIAVDHWYQIETGTG